MDKNKSSACMHQANGALCEIHAKRRIHKFQNVS